MSTLSPPTIRAAGAASDVAVFGLGYVGSASAACLAHLGYRVTGIDRDEPKVRRVLEGRAPFFEPGLDQLVAEGVAAGRLTATTDPAEALANAGIALVCVGTPSAANGAPDLSQLHRVCAAIAAETAHRVQPLVVAIRSTVFPGTCENHLMPYFSERPLVSLVVHPEFLREGTAVGDFFLPPLIVIGGADAAAMDRVASLYVGLAVQPCLVEFRAAEIIKHACNAFHALKIAFANEVGSVCNRFAAPAKQVLEVFCRDTALNISTAYLKPGMPFGGSCLPKDLRAIAYESRMAGLKLPLLEAVLPSNDEHLHRCVQAVLALPGKRLGCFGLAFKEGTDDLRESPGVIIIEQILGRGRSVRIFEPNIALDQICGTNKSYLLSGIPHIAELLAPGMEDVLAWADEIVLTRKPEAALLAQIRQSGLPVLDLSAGGGLQPRLKRNDAS